MTEKNRKMMEISTLGLSQKAYYYNYWNEACQIYPLSLSGFGRKKGGIVGLRRKNKREGGIWEPSVSVDPLTSSRKFLKEYISTPVLVPRSQIHHKNRFLNIKDGVQHCLSIGFRIAL